MKTSWFTLQFLVRHLISSNTCLFFLFQFSCLSRIHFFFLSWMFLYPECSSRVCPIKNFGLRKTKNRNSCALHVENTIKWYTDFAKHFFFLLTYREFWVFSSWYPFLEQMVEPLPSRYFCLCLSLKGLHCVGSLWSAHQA